MWAAIGFRLAVNGKYRYTFSYLREAYDSPVDETLRVTLDRMVCGTAYDGSGKPRVPR